VVVAWEVTGPDVGPDGGATTLHGGSGSAPTIPDPLDDHVHHYPALPGVALAWPHPYAYRGPLFAQPVRTSPGTRTLAACILTFVSALDLWAFLWSLGAGPVWLAPFALAGLVATGLHLRRRTRRVWSARRPSFGPVRLPALEAASPHRAAGRMHARFASPARPFTGPAPLWSRGRIMRTARIVRMTRPLTTPSAVVTGISVLAALVVHVAR
jgi:hypothetical protein